MELQKTLCLLLNVIVFTCAREPSSPICSRYDYEERLLERVLRNELALETTLNEILKTNGKVGDALKDLEDGKAKVESTLAVIEQKQLDMESKLSDFINNASNNMNSTLASNVDEVVKAASDIKANATVTVQQLVKQVQILKDQLKVPTIYFRARLSASITDLPSGKDLVFPTVEVNEGEGYDPSNGIFTASIPGMYLFSVQYCAYSQKYVYLEIVNQGKTLQRSSNSGRSEDWPCMTMQASTVVAKGHQVWVRTTSTSTLYDSSVRYTSFSGTLIHV
ncbi:uncharacterized protein LOC127835623 [Dreissena polymorpha]|uniref:C1q domain-containing protein n=1 Tax=Dreissena polymorpha TaxID=45954 RepID=A0A9D4G544_DREPO|nr:uncharacterized protein LOC127835623 [Dreissena polymorpha]KAH3807737.1 hypothetical protein DPMN_136085 [Dreissena polymorpha]